MPQSCTRLHCSAKMPVVFLILRKRSRSQRRSLTHPSPYKLYKRYRWKRVDKAKFRICSLLLKNPAFFITNKHLLFTYAFQTPLLLLLSIKYFPNELSPAPWETPADEYWVHANYTGEKCRMMISLQGILNWNLHESWVVQFTLLSSQVKQII